MRRPSPLPPCDERLAGTHELLEPTGLRRLLGLDRRHDPEVRYLEYTPGSELTVQVRVGPELAAITLTTDDPPRVVRYPDDTALPGLADGWSALADRFGLGRHAPSPLAWVPGRRLVVADDDRVLKLHRTGDETDLAVATARLVGRAVPAPAVLDLDLGLAAHVQERVDGRALGRDDALERAVDAAALVQRLHRADRPAPDGFAGVADYGPDELVAACGPVVDLVAFAHRELADRAVAVLDQLAGVRPSAAGGGHPPGVPSHGDFNVGQLVAGPSGLTVVDTDTLCRAPAAFDLASYAANVVSGRPGDLVLARRVLERLVDAYGERPDDLDWYLAAMVVRRLDRAIRRFKRRWPERTGQLVADAEELLGRRAG